MAFRSRIIGQKMVRAGDLAPNGKNFRKHGSKQKAALRDVLEDVGFVSGVIARELPDGTLELLDGHARVGLDPDELIPVQLVNLTDAEADKVLATFDPLGAMAETDAALARALVERVSTEDASVRAMLRKLAPEAKQKLNLPEDSDEKPREKAEKRDEERWPLAIVLDVAGYRRWKAWKARVETGSDTKALLALMESVEVQDG